MKKYILLVILFTPLFVSCQKEISACAPNGQIGLESIKFTALQSNKAFTGALEIFPCVDKTTNYVGNYHNNQLSAINSSCVVAKGTITNWGYQLLLPIGTYNMIYWGLSSADSYEPSRVKSLVLSIGGNLSDQYWSMALNADKSTYMPVWDQVMAVQDAQIGSTGSSVNLSRKVAGLNVTVKNSNNTAFDSSISSFEVLVGGIAEKINAVTGEPVNQTKNVKFALTIDPTRNTASNVTAMLYPSAASPSITIIAKLKDGQSRSYVTNLRNAFQANSVQSITILTADILSSDPLGVSFNVDDWQETSQTIDAPII